MKYSIYNRNSKDRTSIYSNPTRSTIRFKVLFPTFEKWKENLKDYGIKESIIIESDYKYLNGMIGNAFLKFKTELKNKSAISFRFTQFYEIREREQKLYDLDIKDFLSQNSENVNTFYLTDRSEDGQTVDADYIANKTKQELTSTLPYAQLLNELNKFNTMVAPQLLFLSRLANSIVFPVHEDERSF